MKKPKRVLAYYNGKVVDMATYVSDPKRRFSIAAMRIVDNGAEGYVLDGDKLYFVGRNSRTSKPVAGDDRDRVIGEIEGLLSAPIKHYKIELKLLTPARAIVEHEVFVSGRSITEAIAAAKAKVPPDHRLYQFGRAVEQP